MSVTSLGGGGGDKGMHYLSGKNIPRAGTGRSNARNRLNVIKSIPGLISRNRESVQKRASVNIVLREADGFRDSVKNFFC